MLRIAVTYDCSEETFAAAPKSQKTKRTDSYNAFDRALFRSFGKQARVFMMCHPGRMSVLARECRDADFIFHDTSRVAYSIASPRRRAARQGMTERIVLPYLHKAHFSGTVTYTDKRKSARRHSHTAPLGRSGIPSPGSFGRGALPGDDEEQVRRPGRGSLLCAAERADPAFLGTRNLACVWHGHAGPEGLSCAGIRSDAEQSLYALPHLHRWRNRSRRRSVRIEAARPPAASEASGECRRASGCRFEFFPGRHAHCAHGISPQDGPCKTCQCA